MNNNIRNPIRRKLMAVLLLLCAGALVLSGLLWFGSLLAVRDRVVSDNEKLGDTAYSRSALSMMELTEKNYVVTAENRAQTIDAILARYLGYVGDFAFYAHKLYENPKEYVSEKVLPFDNKSAYEDNTMQLHYANKSAEKETMSEEVGLLANAIHIWQPVMESRNSLIGSIYLCTESGFMIKYGERSDLTTKYFNFFESEWYITPKETGKTFFTDVYTDSLGRGLMITCAAPFYDNIGNFAGVMCIDIMINDIGEILSDVNLGTGSCTYLVDGEGDVIISPQVLSEVGFDNFKNNYPNDYMFPEHIMYGESGGEYGGTDNSLFFAYSPIESANWTLVFQIPSDLITNPSMQTVSTIKEESSLTVDGINKSILIVSLLNLILIIIINISVNVISRVLSKKMIDPLLKLKHDASIISGGDLEHRAEICDIDEIGDIARSFNDMAALLDKRIKDLKRDTAEWNCLSDELEVTKRIQASILPSIFPTFPVRREFDVFAMMSPAKEGGSDFYDFFMVDKTHVAIVIADVHGKGVSTALFMAVGKTLIRDHTVSEADLESVFNEVNNLLCASNSEGLFMTAFEGVLDLVSGEFRFVNAKHEMPFISNAGTEFKLYKTNFASAPLADMKNISYKSGRLMLEPGDSIFQYSDGVIKATNKDGELYGIERLENILNENSDRSPEEIICAVKEDICKFSDAADQIDDITMLAFKFKEKMEKYP